MSNLTLILTGPVHLEFAINFISHISENIRIAQSYTDIAFLVNDADTPEELIEKSDVASRFLALAKRHGIHVYYNEGGKNGGYEVAAYRFARDYFPKGKYRYLLFLQCTTQVNSPEFWSRIFDDERELFLDYNENGGYGVCYLYKLSFDSVRRIDWPIVTTKKESMDFEWRLWAKYLLLGKGMGYPFKGSKSYDFYVSDFLGRKNLVCQNDFFTKFKGCWSLDMVGSIGEFE